MPRKIPVTPYCMACGTTVPDIFIDHHVCVPNGAGGFAVKTRDQAETTWKNAQADTMREKE